jgi:hypothetical protein
MEMLRMNWVIAIGAICLGLVVGWMAGQTFVQLKRFDVTALASIISVMVGAAVIGIFQSFLGKEPKNCPVEVWFYPVGLLLGVAGAEAISYSQKKTAQSDASLQEATQKREFAESRNAETAKIVICNLLQSKNWTVVSFEGIRDGSGQDWDDEFLSSLIIRYPNTF